MIIVCASIGTLTKRERDTHPHTRDPLYNLVNEKERETYSYLYT